MINTLKDVINALTAPEIFITVAALAFLWALRTRNRLMHDGLSFTKQEAIARHTGQAEEETQGYDALSCGEQQELLAFLDSL